MILIPNVIAWGYPEDNCYDCLSDTSYGKDELYYCRHNSSGLIWGQCCKKYSSTSHECREMYDPEGHHKTRCSDQSPQS